MKYYIELESIKSTTMGSPIDDFINWFYSKFGDRMELTIENLNILEGNRFWNLPYCLLSIIPEDERKEFREQHREYQSLYEPLKKYCGKPSLVDKIVKAASK
jgi:hypothetical protein